MQKVVGSNPISRFEEGLEIPDSWRRESARRFAPSAKQLPIGGGAGSTLVSEGAY
jgi:hypothetical protein